MKNKNLWSLDHHNFATWIFDIKPMESENQLPQYIDFVIDIEFCV